jgi:hypothetical protein
MNLVPPLGWLLATFDLGDCIALSEAARGQTSPFAVLRLHCLRA